MTKKPRSIAVHSSVRSKPKLILSVVEGLATIALLSGIYFYTLTLPYSHDTQSVNFEVTKGESVTTIASHLKDAKLIRSSLYFRYIAKSHKLILQAGKYQLFPSDSPLKLATQLTKGLAVDKKITIPEGFRREQISELTGLNLISPEGRLFPDTYFIKEDITAQELVDLMQANFAKKVGKVDEQTLILASLVERETKGDEEKPVVAGILKKRLENGWPLELDATVQYFLGKPGSWWPYYFARSQIKISLQYLSPSWLTTHTNRQSRFLFASCRSKFRGLPILVLSARQIRRHSLCRDPRRPQPKHCQIHNQVDL